MSLNYTKTHWGEGMPITALKMNNIEDGIDALTLSTNNLSTTVETNNSNVTSSILAINDTIGSRAIYGILGTIWDNVYQAVNDARSAAQGTVDGTKAWNALLPVVGWDNSTQLYEHRLVDVITAITDTIETNRTAAATDLSTAITNIKNILGKTTVDGATVDAYTTQNTVAAAMSLLREDLSDVQTSISNATTGYESLALRLDVIMTRATNARDTAGAVQTEVNNAHRSGLVNSNDEPIVDSLALRFSDDEAALARALKLAASDVGNSNENGDVINHLNTLDTTAWKALDARQGRVLKELLYGASDTAFSINDTVAHRIAGVAASVAELDTLLNDNNTGLTGVISDIQLILTDALTSTAVQTNDNDTTYNSLDERLEAIESTQIAHASASNTRFDGIDTTTTGLRTDLNVIAAELSMLDNGAVVDTNTSRVDTIESDLSGVATRVGTIEDELDAARVQIGTDNETGDPIMGTLDDRFDAIDNAISHTASGNDAGGLTERLTAAEGDIDTLESTIGDANTGLAATKAIADAATSGLATLAGRVTSLELNPQSATVVIEEDRISYHAETGLPTIYTDSTKTEQETLSTDVDYLLEKDDKYYYWKYIQTATDPAAYTWELISGGGSEDGGTGTSSAEIVSELPSLSAADANIDYYVGSTVTGYTHYRYIPSETEGEDGVFVSILPNNLINSVSVGSITVTTADALGETPATTATMSGGLTAYNLGDTSHQTNLLSSFTALRYARIKRTYDGEELKKQELIFTDTNGNDMAPIEIVGGSGTGAAYTVRLLGGSSFNVPASETNVVTISPRPIVNFGSTLAEGIEITATVQYKLSTSNVWLNAAIDIPTITNNIAFNLNVASLLGAVDTTTNVRVTISTKPDGDEGETYTQSTTYNITRVNMSIMSINYNPAAIRTGASFQFNYKCIGVGLEKIVYFKIDGVTVDTETISADHDDNQQLAKTISLSELTTGMHSLQVYFMAGSISSNVINTYLICNKDSEREAPIVGASFNSPSINQGDDLTLNYTVYTPGAEKTDEVTIEVYTIENDTPRIVRTIDLENVDNSVVIHQPIIGYPDNVGETIYTLYVTVTATKHGDTDLTDTVTTSIDIKPFASQYTLRYAGTDNLVYSYTAAGRTNNDADKETHTHVYTAHDTNNTQITFTGSFNNFNWSTDGYNPETGALTISGGATHTINVPIFSSTAQGVSIETDTDSYIDPTLNGRTIELDFTVRSATNLKDVIMSCMGANHAGFKVTPQNCYLLNTNVDVSLDDTGAILNESSIAAAYLTTGVRTHLVFVIEPWAAEKAYDKKYHQSVNIYINGEFANACPYNRDNSTGNISDSFTTDATITMGSSSCIIDLYSVKLYNRGLTHTEVLQNYKMAPASRADKIARFEANDIIKNGAVDYELARKKFNCLLLVGPNPVYAENEQHLQYNTKPTISPYKGAPSPIGRMKDGEVVGKTESGLVLTIPNNDENHPEGYQTEFSLLDKMNDGGYASSNNVQGTSSQKYPLHNLKVYLMKGDSNYQELDAETGEPTGRYTKSAKVKYKIPGSKGKGESTLCWKADYMSTDHANTFNANIADSLFSESLNPEITDESWRSKVQNTVNGMRCLLFLQQGDNPPEFVGDGCLNNDKGNSKTFGLEYPVPSEPEEIDPNAEYDNASDATDTVALKWEFTNNSDALGFFKYDSLFYPIGADNHYRALDAFESCYPDQGDLEDGGLEPNYNHLQVLSTWVSQRANYWDASDTVVPGTTYTYDSVTYDNLKAYKKAIFKNEFEDHFNLDHVLVYYLFSEYVALCDNRVKNMFMRSDTIRKEVIRIVGQVEPLYEGNSNPNASFWKEFTDIDTGEVDEETGDPIIEHRMKNANLIDWENSTFAIWAPVLYDLDSCFGVENVGLLKIPYNADWQYYQDGQYLFNGHDSVFWLMFEDSFGSEIAAKALTLYNRDRGLNYNTFYQELIVGNNNAIAPAMTNQDMILKFDVPWATGFMNYSNKPPTYETPEYKYLQRGSRATQKTSFIFKRSMLLSSKYQTNAFKNDRISMRYGADVSMANAVVKLSGNQIFYPAVSFGDNKGWTQALELEDGTPVVNGRVNAGEVCRIRATSPAGGQDTLFIGGASVLTDVGDLSVFKAYEINVSPAVNLKKIAFGSHEAGYINEVTQGIGGLSSCVLLEDINIENCTNFLSLDLSANGLIKHVHATGSGAAFVSLPTGGVLETLELGAATSNIKIINQSHLQTFSYENSNANHYANLNKLWIENTPNVPVVDIINNAIGHLDGGIRLIGINVSLGDDPTFLEKITSDLAKGKYMTNQGTVPLGNDDYPTITGTVTISTIRQSLFNILAEHYPDLIINAVSIIPEYTITYKNYNGVTLYVDHKTASERYIDPVKDINSITGVPYYPLLPQRPEDELYYYYFGRYNTADPELFSSDTYIRYSGWSKVDLNGNITQLTNEYVTGTTTVIAEYRTTQIRSYTVEWYEEELQNHNNEVLIKSITAEYGTRVGDYIWPDEDGSFARAKLVNESYYKVFTGWNRPVGILTGNVKVYGQWRTSNITNATTAINFDSLTGADLYALAHIGSTARTNLLSSHLNLDTISIPLGHDFNYTAGVTSYNLVNSNITLDGAESSAVIFNGASGTQNIRPFLKVLNSSTGEYEYQDFTFAFDYKALITNTLDAEAQEYVLASCYEQTNSTMSGFKIVVKNTDSSLKPVIVTWGSGNTQDTYAIIDYVEINSDLATSSLQYSHGYRNIVVLSFSKDDPTKLNVYYASPGASPSLYGQTVLVSTLTWSAPTTSNPLIIGGNYALGTTTIETTSPTIKTRTPCAGIVYWAKFWTADLGGTNCNKLAAWPHEELHCYLTGYDSAASETSKLLLNDTRLTFVTAEVLGDRRYNVLNASWNLTYASWSSVSHNTFYNNRIYSAFSDEYQSIIYLTTLTSNTDQILTIGGLAQRITTTSNNYIFPPAYRELSGSGSVSMNREALGTWPWLNTTTLASACRIYTYESSSVLNRVTSVTDIYPFLYRFSNYHLTPNTKIFRTTVTPYNNNRTWTVRNEGTTVKLASGDIWDTGSAVYIYVSPDDIAAGINIDLPETVGGWKAAEAWILRTFTENQDNSLLWYYFYQVTALGQAVDGSQLTSREYGYYKGLVFEFAV